MYCRNGALKLSHKECILHVEVNFLSQGFLCDIVTHLSSIRKSVYKMCREPEKNEWLHHYAPIIN